MVHLERHTRARPTLGDAPPAPRRVAWLAFVLFVVFVFASSGPLTYHERIVRGAPAMCLFMLCFGWAWWLYGRAIVKQQWFFRWPWRLWTGRQAVRVGYGMMAAGVAFGLLALWLFAILLREL